MLQNRQMNGMLQIMNKKREMAAAISGSHFLPQIRYQRLWGETYPGA